MNKEIEIGTGQSIKPVREADNLPVPRDRRGRILWKTPGNNPEENLSLAISNIRKLVIDQTPELTGVPLDTDGKVEASHRGLIESLILDRIKTSRLLPSKDAVYPSGYGQLHTSLIFRLAVAFGEWGLFQEELAKLNEKSEKLRRSREKQDQDAPKSIRLVYGDYAEHVAPLGQKEGRDILKRLIQRSANREPTHNGKFPKGVVIYVTDLRERKNEPSVTFYVSKDLALSEISFGQGVREAYTKSGAVIFIIKEDEKLGYKWIDVYAVDGDRIDANAKIGSVRINTEEGKIGSQGWHGPEQQAFLEYITGNLDVEDPDVLQPFVVKVPARKVYLGGIGGKNIEVPFNERVIRSDDVVIVPRYNRSFGYFWIEGYGKDDHEREAPLFSRRVTVSNKPVEDAQITEWKGPQIQSLVDWAYGKLPTSLLEEAEVSIDPQTKHSHIHLEAPNLAIRLNKNSAFDKAQPIYLIARENELYRWIEVQQNNPDGSRRLVSRLFLDTSSGKPALIGRWQGPERQAVVDYIDDRIDKAHLDKITGILGSGKVVYVANYHGKNLRIVLRSTGFSEGEIVTLTPFVDEEGNLVFEVTKIDDPNNVMAKAIFDKGTKQFKTRSLEAALNRKPFGYWDPEKIKEMAMQIYGERGDLTYESLLDEAPSFCGAVSSKYPGRWTGLRRDIGITQADESGIFMDGTGVEWGSIHSLQKESGLNYKTIRRLLVKSTVDTREGRGANGVKTTFYNLNQARKIITETGEEQSITSDQANEQLAKLIEASET